MKASMRAAETACDAGFRGLDTLNSTLNTPHVTAAHPSLTEIRVTSVRDGHSSDVATDEPADAASEAHPQASAGDFDPAWGNRRTPERLCTALPLVLYLVLYLGVSRAVFR